MTAAVEKHLAARLLPAGFAPVVEEVIALLVAGGLDVVHDMVSLPAGLPRLESGLMFDDGTQTIRVLDFAVAVDLKPLLPEEWQWSFRYEKGEK